MKLISAVILQLLITTPLAYCTMADLNCGKLNISQVYNENSITKLDEHPWIGRVYSINTLDKTKVYHRCNAVLVSQRHLLSVAHCFWDFKNESRIVLLGGANYGYMSTEPDCDENGFCTPLPKKYSIQDIAIHPNYDYVKHRNDLAIIHLTEPVELNDYIKPICLPPASTYTTNLYGQYLIYTGYVSILLGQKKQGKLKTVAHIGPLEHCNNLIDYNINPLHDVCGSYIGHLYFRSGSALMGVDIDNVDLQLRNYYLVGLSTYISLPLDGSTDVFARISSYINWIQSNIALTISYN